jgi:hypothetical protein
LCPEGQGTRGLLAVLLGGLGGAAVWQWRVAERAQGEAEEQRDSASLVRSEAETARGFDEKSPGRGRAAAGKVRAVRIRAHHPGDPSRVAGEKRRCEPDLRGWEWRYVHRLCHSDMLISNCHNGDFNAASFSPDGSQILTARDDKTAKVWDARSDAEVLKLEGHADAVTETWFSPDGSRVITGSFDKTVNVWDATPINREFQPREFAPTRREGEVR